MKAKETFLTVDPPSGWKYGFPKAVTQEQYKSIKNLKQWCIDNGYPKAEADSYGDYFHIQINGDLSFTLMNETVSTRRLALKWWNDESNLLNRTALFDRYFSNTATKDKMFTVANNYKELTGREIEEIYNKEVLEPKNQKEWQESQVNRRYSKPNAKEFKQFDESLFRAYISKFSEEDKIKAFEIIIQDLSKNGNIKKIQLELIIDSNMWG